MDPCLAMREYPATPSNLKCLHAVIDNEVFIFLGPKPYDFPRVPPKNQILDPSYRTPALPDFSVSGWMDPLLPFLGFLPSSNPFKTSFLRSLDYSYFAMPIERLSNNMFALDKSLQSKWETLETTCRLYLNACMASCPGAFEPGFRFWSYPKQFGYCRCYFSEKVARAVAARSRLAFLPLIAAISFLLQILFHCEVLYNKQIQNSAQVSPPISDLFLTAEQNEDILRRGLPVALKWNVRERLRQKTEISSSFLAQMEEVLQIPPIGTFIDIRDPRCCSLIPTLSESNMPLVLYLGTVDQWSSKSISHLNFFLLPEYDSIRDLATQQTPYLSPVTAPSPSHLPHINHPPKLSLRTSSKVIGPQQLPGETWQSFLQRRNVFREKIIASESEGDRVARLAREAHAQKNICPGRKGPRVFWWDNDGGVRIRTPAGSHKEEIWFGYGDKQRIYDSVTQEWDCCSEFAPDDVPDPDLDDNDDDIYDDILPTNGAESSKLFVTSNFTSISAEVDESSCYEQDDSPSLDSPFVKDILHYRFGYTSPVLPSRNVVCIDKVWKQALGMIGAVRPPTPTPTSAEASVSICSFLSGLANAGDLTEVPYTSDLTRGLPNLLFTLSCDLGHYWLDSGDPGHDIPCLVAVSSAAVILEVIRRRLGKNISDVVRLFVKQGIQFRTLISENPLTFSRPFSKHRFVPLGYRGSNNFTLDDFHAYENRRNNFLRSPRGRAALMAGGIIARLAREVADVQDVLDGPSPTANEGGDRSFRLWEEGYPCPFWDDQLNQEEIDLICGTYEIPTGNRSEYVSLF